MTQFCPKGLLQEILGKKIILLEKGDRCGTFPFRVFPVLNLDVMAGAVGALLSKLWSGHC